MPRTRVDQRRLANRQRVKTLLQQLISEQSDVYSLFRQLYSVWCSSNAAVQELRPMFRLDGVEPDGHLSITPEFTTRVKALASEILPKFEDVPD